MPAVGGSAGSFGALIVTPDMVPPDAAGWDAHAQAYRAGAAAWDGIHQQIVRDNAARRDAADSRGFDAAHEAGAILAEEAKTISEWHDSVATKANNVAGVLRDTATAQEQLIRDADAKIQAAKLPGEREALVTAYHSQARVQTGWGVEAATALHTSFQASTENTRALTLLTKFGDMPTAPPVQPLDNTSPGIEQEADDPWRKPADDGSTRKPTAESPTDSAGSPATRQGFGPAAHGGAGNEGINAGPATRAPLAGSPGQASPLGGGAPSMSGMGGGSGMGSGAMPSMPSGMGSGGMPGMSSSPLTGLGEMPGAAGGLTSAGNVSGSAGAASPAAAFSRGVSSGAGIGGGMPAMPPNAPASPSPALSAGGSAVSAAPVSAAAAGGGVAPGAVQPGVVAPAAPAAPAGAGMGSGAPMMLPPGAMGPPAAAMPAAAAAPAIPAGTGAAGGSAHTSAAPPSSAGGGATLIPASVVAAGQTAAARERRESADAAAAKELAWKLQHAAVHMNSAATDWAVGIFRSPSGTETVITTNDGASFIPHSVHVPRSVRLLAADPLVDDHFRQLWFGWHDPARVLVEYARMRSETGWRLVAAATTGAVTALRDAGVEHPPSCSRDINPLLRPGETVAPPSLDGLHVHRLSLLWPEVYPRLLRVMEAAPVYQERIVNAVSALMLNAATTQAVAVEGGIPDAIRRVWSTRGAPHDPSAQEWAAYDEQVPRFNMQVAMARPGFMSGGADPSETIDEFRNYRAHWLIARTAEHIAGWSTRPLPLPDMCYAAVTLGQMHIRELIEEALSSVEDDLRAMGAA